VRNAYKLLVCKSEGKGSVGILLKLIVTVMWFMSGYDMYYEVYVNYEYMGFKSKRTFRLS
jgi:hypothetical protein